VRQSKRMLAKYINNRADDPYTKPYDCLTELPKI